MMMTRSLFAAAMLVVAALSVGPAAAQDVQRTEVPVTVQPAASSPMRIGVREQPPFAMEGPDGAWTGIGVDLWRLIAEREGYAYDWVTLDGGPVEAVASGAVDVVLPVTPTAETEERIDFTHPYFTATLGAAGVSRVNLVDTARAFVSWRFLRIVLAISALLLVVGAIVWLIERKANAAQFGTPEDAFEGDPGFGRRAMRGLGSGFWWSGVTLTTIGYGDKAPVTTLGRAVAMIWMLIALAITSSLTASIVAATDISSAGRLRIPGDLEGLSLGTVEESAAAAYLANEGLTFTTYPSVEEAMADTADGRIDAAIGPLPALQYAREDGDLDLMISPSRAEPNLVSFGMAEGSDLVAPINAALLDLTTGSGWVELVERYAPDR